MEKFYEVILGFVTGIANGLFGSGGGTIVVPGMEKFLKVDAHKAHGSAIAVILPLTILSMLIYINKIEIDYKAALFVSIGGVIGGIIGAKLLMKISGKAIHKIFGAIMLFAAFRMFFS